MNEFTVTGTIAFPPDVKVEAQHLNEIWLLFCNPKTGKTEKVGIYGKSLRIKDQTKKGVRR